MKLTSAEQFLQDLVAIPSITADRKANDQALDYIASFLQAQGMHVAQHTYTETIGKEGEASPVAYGTLVATTATTKTPTVMLSAHVDVVPAPSAAFHMQVTNDKLTGRGVADMKFSIAAYMEVVRRLQGHLHEYDFGITIVSNEEIAGHGVQHLLKDGYIPKVAVLPDGAGDWDLEQTAKGAWTVRITAPGVSAHGSRPWDGESASFKLLDALSEVRALFTDQGLATDTLNISLLSAGTAVNTVPAEAHATLDIRVMSRQSLASIQEQVLAICARHGLTHSVTGFFPPIEHDLTNPYIQDFKASVQAVTNLVPGMTISCSACDAAYYDQHDVTTIVTRPPCGGEHALNEWISRQGFAQFTDVLEDFVKKTSQVPKNA